MSVTGFVWWDSGDVSPWDSSSDFGFQFRFLFCLTKSSCTTSHFTVFTFGKDIETLGILVDKDDLINYQLVISYGLLVRILTYQPTVDTTIVLSANCWWRRVCGWWLIRDTESNSEIPTRFQTVMKYFLTSRGFQITVRLSEDRHWREVRVCFNFTLVCNVERP